MKWCVEFPDFNTRFERNLLNGHLRRARKMMLPATLTMRQWHSTVQYFNGQCAYCQKKPYQVIEHFLPLGQGGSTSYTNCVPACQSCNVLKGGTHPLQLINSPLSNGIRQVAQYLGGIEV